ncbi:MAG: radical SAM protein, partial [bacterium]
ARFSISRFQGHARAFVKGQDGCDRRCSFCVIPSIRGSNTSRALPEIREEVRGLLDGGIPEIVLCGVRLNAYRDPSTSSGLAALVRALVGLPDLRRLRLSSVYPGRLDPELVELLAAHPAVCKHLHLPFQSGSDAVLRAMRRGYAAADVIVLADELRRRCPDFGLTADVLGGFPGETDADADATARIADAGGFHKLHLFPFSARPGTPAASLEPVPAAGGAARIARRAALGDRLRDEAQERLVGREAEVVVEGRPRAGLFRGLTGTYHHVRFADAAFAGSVARVRVSGRAAGELAGEVVHG